MEEKSHSHGDEGKEKDARKEYEALARKHSLPALDALDREFLIGQLEPGSFILRSVLIKMQDRCEFALKILNDVIQPENHLADMRESEAVSEADRKKVLDLIRKLSFRSKGLLIGEFDYSEENAASMIKEFYEEWQALRPEVVRILGVLRDAWKKEAEAKPDYAYFG